VLGKASASRKILARHAQQGQSARSFPEISQWHGGGLDKAGRTRGFQLWITLPPAMSPRRATPSSRPPSHQAPYRFPRSCGNATWRLRTVIQFEALTDTELVFGSAVPHSYDLVLGSHNARHAARCPGVPFRDSDAPRRASVGTFVRSEACTPRKSTCIYSTK
jgi:hypothetical protein